MCAQSFSYCKLQLFVVFIKSFSIHSQVDSNIGETEIHHSRSQLDVYEDISNLRASDLKLRIEEMLRIKVSKFLDKISIAIRW